MGRRSKKEQKRLDTEALVDHLSAVLSKTEVSETLYRLIPKVVSKVIERSIQLGRRKTDLDAGEEVSALILDEVFLQGHLHGIRHCTTALTKAIETVELKEKNDDIKITDKGND